MHFCGRRAQAEGEVDEEYETDGRIDEEDEAGHLGWGIEQPLGRNTGEQDERQNQDGELEGAGLLGGGLGWHRTVRLDVTGGSVKICASWARLADG